MMFTPKTAVPSCGVGFTVMATVAVLKALDRFRPFRKRAAVKWVNDILIDDAKIGGVLTQLQTQGELVRRAVVGIGLNALTTPRVEPTPFVPAVASLADFGRAGKHWSIQELFFELCAALAANYGLLLRDYDALLEEYRDRSCILGRRVILARDSSGGRVEEIARGTAISIGRHLELELEGGPQQFRTGRLILDNSSRT
jgi:BirA family biotin operon repressor/biotin-[acetyl-CoA-carboxylase] ligase